MTRVVVTGGAGFLGSYLCERLLDDGCEVLVLDNLVTGPAVPSEVSVLDLARRVSIVTGSKSHVTFIDRPQDDPTVRQPDITLAREVLGWEPRVPVEEGLERTVRWFQERRPTA